MGWANQTINSTVASQGWTENIKWTLVTFDSTGFGFYWNLVALTIFIILILAYVDTRSPTYQHDTHPTQPALPSKGEYPIPSVINREPKETLLPAIITEQKPQTPDSSELGVLAPLLPTPIPTHLTGTQATNLIANLKRCSEEIHMKVCSTQEHMEFTKELVNIFRAAGVTFIIDERRLEPIFFAQSTHNKIVIRFREGGPPSHSLTCFTLSLIFYRAFDAPVDTNTFPQESNIDYFQIEIGGAP